MKTIAVITGASAGMGMDFARQIDQVLKPDQIWLVARRKDRLDALAAELRPGVGLAVEADLGDNAQADALALKLEAACGPGTDTNLVAFVNNAGFGTYGPCIETDIKWQLSMVDLNVRALTRLSWTAGRLMGKGGLLVNVASLASFMPLGNFAVYAATKAYVLSFTLALGAELEGKGIRTLALCPGPVSTEFAKVASGGARTEVLHGKEPSAVVAHCLRKALGGKALAVLGLDWKFQAFLSRIVGRRAVARLTWRHMKRPQADKAD